MDKMTKAEQFIKDFESWCDQQIQLMAHAAQLAHEENEAEAAIRYESRLDAYQFLQGKFENYRQGKGFHELPDNF
jgi:hypothetical protein